MPSVAETRPMEAMERILLICIASLGVEARG